MNATIEKSTRPDTSDLYEFMWISDSGLPVECYFDYAPPDPDDELIPSAPARDPGMELKHAFICGNHDIADWLTVHISEQMERLALLDYLKKDSEAREKKYGLSKFFAPSRDYRSLAGFLG